MLAYNLTIHDKVVMEKRKLKAIILAAGIGSRLGGQGPKPLTRLVNDHSILELQVNELLKYPQIDDIIVVVGYQKEKIIEAFPDLSYVTNLEYATTNTSKSLLKALKKCSPSSLDSDQDHFSDILWLNGDVIFHPSVLTKIFGAQNTCMVVNVGSVGFEEVKYTLKSDGRIVEVSKHVKNPLGEALGINYFKAEDVPELIKGLEQCSDTDYFERGIEYCIESGTSVFTAVVSKELCIEIDFPEDLVRANHMLS